jgi:hypothetical protein
MKNKNSTLTIILMSLCFLGLTSITQLASAATVTSATLNKDVYLAGQTGYISVTVYNDKATNITVTELSATINYYYQDGTIYIQKFFTNATLSSEIAVGQSQTYQVPISLPVDIASGYTSPIVEVKTDIWQPLTSRWTTSDRPTYQVKLYIESPYKQMYDNSQQNLTDAQTQLDKTQMLLQQQRTSNENLTNTSYVLIAVIVAFALACAGLFLVFKMKPHPTPQPAP